MGPKLLSQSSLVTLVTDLVLLPRFVLIIRFMAVFVILQSIMVFIGSGFVLQCFFKPEKALFELDQLARFMYLYDYHTCHKTYSSYSTFLGDLQLDNNTYGLDVLPIRFEHVITSPLSKLPAATRMYLQVSIVLHALWVCSACLAPIFARRHGPSPLNKLKLFLGILFYYSVFMHTFDLSMAIVYAAHIQQSLTKGMILRYSGTNIIVDIENVDDFGGWVPIGASILWARGILIFAVNLYFTRSLNRIRYSMRKREYTKIFSMEGNIVIPEAGHLTPNYTTNVLVYNVNGEGVNY